MGVHGLWRLLDRFSHTTSPEAWRGKYVAVDASVWMAQFRTTAGGRSVGRRSGVEPSDGVGDANLRLIEGFAMRIMKLLFYDITPIFVFDGASSASKLGEKFRRRQRREHLRRRAIWHHARRAVAAQVAAGVFPAEATLAHLKSCKPPQESCLDHMLQEKNVRAPLITQNGCRGKRRRFRIRRAERWPQHVVVSAPECVSRRSTKAFVEQSAVVVAHMRLRDKLSLGNILSRHMNCNGSGRRFDTSTRKGRSTGSSSSLLFMGPRHALESPPVAANCPTTDAAPLHPNVSIGDSLWISSDQSNVSVPDDDDVACVDRCDVRWGWLPSNGVAAERPPRAPGNKADTIIVDVDDPLLLATADDPQRDVTMTDDDAFEVVVLRRDASEAVDLNDTNETFVGSESSASSSAAETTRHTRIITSNPTPRTVIIPFNVDDDVVDEVDDRVDDVDAVAVVNTTGAVCSPPLAPPRSAAELGVKVERNHREVETIPLELEELVDMLRLFDVRFVISPSEADAQCSFLSRCGAVDAVFSEDSDVVVHGATRVLRGFFSSGVDVRECSQDVLTRSGLDRAVLLSLTQVLGCDYVDGIGVGLAEAVTMVSLVRDPSWRGASTQIHERGVDAALCHESEMAANEALRCLRRLQSLHQPLAANAAVPLLPDWSEELSLVQQHVLRRRLRSTGWLKADRHRLQALPSTEALTLFTDSVAMNRCVTHRPGSPRPHWAALRQWFSCRGLHHLLPKLEMVIRQRCEAEKGNARSVNATTNQQLVGFRPPGAESHASSSSARMTTSLDKALCLASMQCSFPVQE